MWLVLSVLFTVATIITVVRMIRNSPALWHELKEMIFWILVSRGIITIDERWLQSPAGQEWLAWHSGDLKRRKKELDEDLDGALTKFIDDVIDNDDNDDSS